MTTVLFEKKENAGKLNVDNLPSGTIFSFSDSGWEDEVFIRSDSEGMLCLNNGEYYTSITSLYLQGTIKEIYENVKIILK